MNYAERIKTHVTTLINNETIINYFTLIESYL